LGLRQIAEAEVHVVEEKGDETLGDGRGPGAATAGGGAGLGVPCGSARFWMVKPEMI
jgi:hypothetical protein